MRGEIMFLANSLRDFYANNNSIKLESKRAFLKLFVLFVWGFSVRDYANYNFGKKRIIDIIKEYIPYYRRQYFRGNKDLGAIEILQDKHKTNKYLHQNGIATTKVKYLILKGVVFEIDENCQVVGRVDKIQQGRYVIKPTNQRWGIGIHFVNVEDEVSISECCKLDEIIRTNRENNLLVEEEVLNHPKLMHLSPYSLNTLRIVTVKSNESIRIIFSCIRFSSNKGRIDNWSSGGYAANVDIVTGISQSAVKKVSDSNAEINEISNGFTVPYFSESKKMVIEAHALFKNMKSIGWDVAITKNGPIIVEGNDDWDVILPQKLLQKGIWNALCKE
jgi:hypothetical protein